MDKDGYDKECLWNISGSSGEERGFFFCHSHVVGLFELMVNHVVFVKGEVLIICSIDNSQLLYWE